MKALTLALALFLTLNSQAAPLVASDWPSDLYDRLRTDIANEIDHAGADLQESVFESLSDISLLSIQDDQFRLAVDVERKVYKNYDLLNSYTVIDFMRVPLTWPIPLGESVQVGAAGLQFQLGLTLTPELMNIRQVLPADFDQLEHPGELQVLLSDQVQNLDSAQILPPARDIYPWNSHNPLTRARYSQFWNLFTGPLKLPLSAERFRERLKHGEIVSYALKGRIELGASVGWSAIHIPGLDEVTPGIGLSTYLDGVHRLSIMKESDEIALVKVTRTRSKGQGLSVGATHPDHVLFEGVVVLGSRLGEIDAEVVPFSFSAHQSEFESFDVTYRYDLTTSDGVAAYERAVLGRLALSDSLAAQNLGVEKVLTRTQDGSSHTRTHKMVLSFLAERSHSVSESAVIAKVTLADGKQVILHRASSTNVRTRASILGHKEIKSYAFKATLDEELFAQGDQGLVLRIEGKIEDNRTRASEIYRYMKEMETLAGQPQFFPRPPQEIPCHDSDCGRSEMASYGESSFYFRLGVTRTQIERFIATPKAQMWPALERAFGVERGAWSSLWRRMWYGTVRSPILASNLPLGLIDLHIKAGSKLVRAKAFQRDWLKLQEIYFQKEGESLIVSELAALFTSHYFSYELARVLRVVLEDEQLSYYLAGNVSQLFGHLSRSGVELAPLDATYDALDRQINFDRVGGRDLVDQNYQIKELKLARVDADTFQLTFELPMVPDFLFVSLDRSSNWRSQKNVHKFILANKYGELRKGANTIVIKRDSLTGLAGELAPGLFTYEGEWLTLSLAIGKDSKWGALAQVRDTFAD